MTTRERIVGAVLCGGCRVWRSAGGRPAGRRRDRAGQEKPSRTYYGDGRWWDREMLVAAGVLPPIQSPQLSRPQLSAFNDANAATRRAHWRRLHTVPVSAVAVTNHPG
jgi:hypothetical protein